MSMKMKKKLTSRKFWICVAAFLGSMATGIGGLQAGSDAVAAAGTACAIISAAVYAACEAYVDGKSAGEKGV